MTVWNEAGNLSEILESIAGLGSVPAEVVVVDGGSTDGTVGLLRSWEPPDGSKLVVGVEPGASISAGRNLAISRASYPLVAVTDAGTTLASEWLDELYSALERGADVAAGFFEPGVGSTFEQVLGRIITPDVREIDGSKFLPSSRSIAFRASAWAAVGGYPEWLDYCEDLVFDLALKDHGYKFEFVPDATVTWNARSSLPSFAKQYYRYARGDGKAGLWAKRHAARYGAYLLGLGLLAAGAAEHVIWLVLVVAVGTYLAKFVRRAWRPRGAGSANRLLGVVMVPVVVLIGDIAKMLGYPVGVAWRRSRARRASVHGPST